MKIGAINMVLQGNSFRYRLIVHPVDVGHTVELSRVTGPKGLDRCVLYTTIVLHSADRCVEIITDIIKQVMQGGHVRLDHKTDYTIPEANEDDRTIIAEP